MGFFQSIARGRFEEAFRGPSAPSTTNVRGEQVFAQQQALVKLQERFFTQQQALAEQQNRGIMESLGYRQDPDTGEFVRLPQTEAERRFSTITRLQQERQIAALEGTAPVDPATERDISEAQAQAQRQADEVGGEESTAGRQIMAKFNEWANIVRAQGRRGEITGGFQNLLGGEAVGLQQRQQILSGFGSLGRSFAGPSQTLGQIGGVLGTIDTSVPTTQTQTSPWAGFGQVLGSALGQRFSGPLASSVGGAFGRVIGSSL